MHPVLILIAAKALGIGAYSAWKKGQDAGSALPAT